MHFLRHSAQRLRTSYKLLGAHFGLNFNILAWGSAGSGTGRAATTSSRGRQSCSRARWSQSRAFLRLHLTCLARGCSPPRPTRRSSSGRRIPQPPPRPTQSTSARPRISADTNLSVLQAAWLRHAFYVLVVLSCEGIFRVILVYRTSACAFHLQSEKCFAHLSGRL